MKKVINLPNENQTSYLRRSISLRKVMRLTSMLNSLRKTVRLSLMRFVKRVHPYL
ncbi:hypothetical protein [Halobacillus massiliensis]|uniref:hypothetical protein n=1 Tax=Halobacillus massiliensis TaxID=1926286 RepID=UPI0015C4AA03|nr:hypothetical protein [Halobacillus massiliensis]